MPPLRILLLQTLFRPALITTDTKDALQLAGAWVQVMFGGDPMDQRHTWGAAAGPGKMKFTVNTGRKITGRKCRFHSGRLTWFIASATPC